MGIREQYGLSSHVCASRTVANPQCATLRPFVLIYTGAYTGSVSAVSLECWRPSTMGKITRTPSLNPESCNKPFFPAGRQLEQGQLARGQRAGLLVFKGRGSRLEGGAYCHSWSTEPMDSRGSDAGSQCPQGQQDWGAGSIRQQSHRPPSPVTHTRTLSSPQREKEGVSSRSGLEISLDEGEFPEVNTQLCFEKLLRYMA